MNFTTEKQVKDKFKDFRSRPANGGFVSRGGKGNQFSEEYFDYRRIEREQIGTMGVPPDWGSSPARLDWEAHIFNTKHLVNTSTIFQARNFSRSIWRGQETKKEEVSKFN